MPAQLEQNAPPSSYAIADLVAGEPGALPRVLGLTLFRALPLSIGLLAVGFRGRQLVAGSLAGSTTITLYMLGRYAWARR